MARDSDVAQTVALALLALALAAIPGCLAWQSGQEARWVNMSSPPIPLVAGERGTWNARWGDTGSRRRERELRLISASESPLPAQASVEVRVEPRTAVAEQNRPAEGADGWIRLHGRDGGPDRVRIDPPSVERIEYRVTATGDAPASARARLFVPGVEDSSYSLRDWSLLLWTVAFGILAFGCTPLVLSLTRRRRERAWWLEHAGIEPPGSERDADV